MIDKQKLASIAGQMVAKGKGILAADESGPTCDKRFLAVGVPQTEEMRRTYRELLFTAPNVESYLSGVILFDETIRQNATDGTPLSEVLSQKGILPGIKVDKGTIDFAGHDGEKITEGLDGLRQRFAEYSNLGAKFAKWRAVIIIDTQKNLPSDACLIANANVLALYALLAQEAGIVPMLEPEVLLDGTHTIADAEFATARTIKTLFAELARYDVYLPGVILKTSMVVSGKNSGEFMDYKDVAERTARVLRENVPAEVGGVVFLSGGQSPKDSTENLNAIAKLGAYPWGVTYSYSRGIQMPVLELWRGEASKIIPAQEVLIGRLKESSDASLGKLNQ